MIETRIRSGDPLDARTDVLVLGMSTDLLVGASPIEEELKRPENAPVLHVVQTARAVVVGDVLEAPPGTLHVRHLLFAVTHSELTPPTEESVGRCVSNVLTRAAELGYASVTLPPLGTRLCHFTIEESARATLRAIHDVGAAHPEWPLCAVEVLLPYDADVAIWEAVQAEAARAPAPSDSPHDPVPGDPAQAAPTPT